MTFPHRQPTRRARAAAVLAVLAALALLCLAAPRDASAAGRLDTGIADSFYGADGPLLLKRVREAGATTVRLYVAWRSVAPAARPARFDPSNPADPRYDWREVDAQVVGAVRAGLRPIFSVSHAPRWAEGSSAGLPQSERRSGTVRPDPAELGRFALAAARRYSGRFGGLPRVRLWQAWNEPNHTFSLNPQFDVDPSKNATPGTRMLSVGLYRQMLKQVAAAVHGVHASNVVIAGGLAPFFRPEPGGRVAAPLPFMRELLCISRRNRPLRGCEPLRFEAWSTHPFTSGGPTHQANAPHDVSLGDLPEVRRVLLAAARARHIVSRGRLRFWITEFSWDSNPPDRFGLPVALQARWVAEALYRTRRLGIDLFTWYSVRDEPVGGRFRFQAGLWFRCAGGITCDRPKPALTAFRFPFVAFKSRGRVLVWGRTPRGRRGTVLVEQRAGRAWRRVARLRTDRYGTFTRRLRSSRRGPLRARLRGRGDRSVPFSLKRVPDRRVNPFGDFPPDA